ncbi:MAG: hypothetical protein GTN76_05045, partial [Candidatus Aenigmarchaeota archaeon]|nr:hypothetical protein [Candidatus Aenigmarchaeota archaeon]
MRKKTITTIISIIVILFIFSSVSDALMRAYVGPYERIEKYQPYKPYKTVKDSWWYWLRLPDLKITDVSIEAGSCSDNVWNFEAVITVKNIGGNRGLASDSRMGVVASIHPHLNWGDDSRYIRWEYPQFLRAGRSQQFTFQFEIDDTYLDGGYWDPEETRLKVKVFPVGRDIEESNDNNNEYSLLISTPEMIEC